MQPLLYGELVDWYRLLDPPDDHADEVASFIAAFERAIEGPSTTLLELGSGAGHNAVHLAQRFTCTLSDVSAPMLELGRALLPDAEHVLGDMRTLRLGRSFDAVLVHDAVTYMTTEADLRAAIETAYLHTRPGGAAIFTPDQLRESFSESTELHEADDGERSLRCMMWSWDPDPHDTACMTEYAFLLRDGTDVRAVHERHVEGLFPRATWIALLEGVGYRVEGIARPIGDGEHDEVLLCRRPR
ncbi:MAG: methyltransferase domain-containing protein [Deltaproteobacteria bacterium]|nr:methyltransferase domain-containing protein [Nannocystaceae bacterium]